MFGGEKKPHSNQQQSERNDRGNINNRTPRSHKPQDTPAVANFKQRLRNRAHNKLEQNKEQVYSLSAAYNSEDPKSKPLFDELRAVVTQDGELEAKQNQLQRQIGRIEANAQLAGAGQAPFPEDYEQLNPLKDQLEQIKQVRATLLANYPISGLIKTHQVGDDVSDAELDEILNNRLAGVLFDIDTAKERISNGDVPLHQLDAVIPEILAQTPEHQRAEVEQYLKKQQRIDTAIEVGGTLGEIGLTVGAIVSSILSGGVIPTILGGLGTALGIGNAVYQFEKADDLNLIAKTGNAGGNQLLTQPDQAKQDYLLGWANLVLAGVDGGLAIKEGASLLKGAKAAEQILAGGGADVIAKLKPEQIRAFNDLVTAPDDVQAQKLYQSLQQELGEDFDNTYNLFKNLRVNLFGQSELTNSITNLGDDFASRNSSVLTDFSPTPNPTRSNQTIFSGVYDPKTKTFLTKPSGSTKLANGEIPEDLVPPRGGHRRTQRAFSQANPDIDTSKTIGYTIYYRKQGELDVAFFSRGINSSNYPTLRGTAPENLQQEFVKILGETTGLKVNVVPRQTLPD